MLDTQIGKYLPSTGREFTAATCVHLFVLNAVVVFAAVHLVCKAVQLGAHLAELRYHNLFIFAARSWRRRGAALHVEIETAAADQRQIRGKIEAELEHLAGAY